MLTEAATRNLFVHVHVPLPPPKRHGSCQCAGGERTCGLGRQASVPSRTLTHRHEVGGLGGLPLCGLLYMPSWPLRSIWPFCLCAGPSPLSSDLADLECAWPAIKKPSCRDLAAQAELAGRPATGQNHLIGNRLGRGPAHNPHYGLAKTIVRFMCGIGQKEESSH